MSMQTHGISKTIKQIVVFISLSVGMAGPSFSNAPQTHDVPMFHNDDGLGLLQDCTFMKARADGVISGVPTIVAGRSVGCLSSIKSIAQVLYSLQGTASTSTSCLPSDNLDWLEVLGFVIGYMEKQPKNKLSTKSYGVWISDSLPT